MAKSVFNKKIKCLHCGSNFKSKLERKTRKYVCSRYDNYQTCKRFIIREDFIRGLIERRFHREMTDEEVRDAVEYIEVENDLLMTIYLNGQEPIILGREVIKL